MDPKRSAGILLHITSLPSRFGIGDLGPAAYRWIDILHDAGQGWWQILPLGPPNQGDSPYSSSSAFAGNTLLISPELLLRDGFLNRDDVAAAQQPEGLVNYDRVRRLKFRLFDLAWQHYCRSASTRSKALAGDFEEFRGENRDWLNDFALFSAIRDRTGGTPWFEWPSELARRKPEALAKLRRELSGAIDYHSFLQFLFHRQLEALVLRAKKKAVRIMADLPIFVSHDSSEVWSNPHLFLLHPSLRPLFQSGVPPDSFSSTGQLWGNPLYLWRRHAADGFRWWENRVRRTLKYADLIRLDHFRGFQACWKVPGGDETAVRGRWSRVPGALLFDSLKHRLGRLPFVAEDLGTITPAVEALRERYGFPGMKVLQFAFDGDGANPYLPHNYPNNCVVYPGTHDNNTALGWFRSLPRRQRKQVQQYAPEAREHPALALIRLAWESVGGIAIAPLQDLLEIGKSGRMNVPGRASGNWRWRVKQEQLKAADFEMHRELTALCARSASK